MMLILLKILCILISATSLIVLFFAYSNTIDKICNDIKELKINQKTKNILSALTIFSFGISYLLLVFIDIIVVFGADNVMNTINL